MPGKSQQENKKSWRCCLCVFAVCTQTGATLGANKNKNQRFGCVFLYHTRTPHVLHNNTTFDLKKHAFRLHISYDTAYQVSGIIIPARYQPAMYVDQTRPNKKNGASCRQEKTVDPDCPHMGLVPPSRPFPFTGVETPRHHTPHFLSHHTPPPDISDKYIPLSDPNSKH